MTANNQPRFIGYLHSFRGFAILNIVAIHGIAIALFVCNNFSDNPRDPYKVVNELLFHNSTLYFAMISGILFSAILKSKGYGKFFNSKFKNVLLPYLFLTIIFSIFNPTDVNPAAIHTHFDQYLKGVLRNFIYGKAQATYWYIPVLFFLYLATPLIDYLMNIPRWGKVLMILIVVMPLAISRVELEDLEKSDFLSLSTMIYFTGAYAAGMFIGTDPDKWIGWVNKYKHWFIIITILSSAALVYFQSKAIDKFGVWSLRSTLFYVQKMCVSGLFIALFKDMGDRQPRWLNPIANDAFTIYFLHAFYILVSYFLFLPTGIYTKSAPFNFYLTAFAFVLLPLILSMATAWLFKKVFGKYSRMLIGC